MLTVKNGQRAALTSIIIFIYLLVCYWNCYIWCYYKRLGILLPLNKMGNYSFNLVLLASITSLRMCCEEEQLKQDPQYEERFDLLQIELIKKEIHTSQ